MEIESRKRLTLYIGECWHEIEETEYGDFECKHCKKEIRIRQFNHTFQDPADRDAVFEKLMEREEWEAFNNYAFDLFFNEFAGKISVGCFSYMQYLLSRTPESDYRLCVLVDEAIKEGVIG